MDKIGTKATNIDQVGNDITSSQTIYFAVADMGIKMTVPHHIDTDTCLSNFKTFIVEGMGRAELVMSVSLTEEQAPEMEEGAKLLTDESLTWDGRFALWEINGGYVAVLATKEKTGRWHMYASRCFSEVAIYVAPSELYNTSVLSWLLMMAYGQAILRRNSLMLHASVIERNGEAYAFLGKSGTGKSTHSQLWLTHIEGTSLLNDDNPILSVEDNGEVGIYGTPWSGKTHCYVNKRAKLSAIVRLKQAPHNNMTWKEGVASLIAVMPSCTAMRWNRELFDSMVGTVEKVIGKVKIGELECLPNKAAALCCYNEIMQTEYI
ncbi:hypothetical protein ORI89_02605 [Sphingobacterium sp. UT-1RO-CII-1]|uniref:hypothetical protein n=1 Tax=Sphingobacterium sp. UT-1RO-CII-1 TaxID=2995225 RepID=UPI00227A8234|nr:hypothetical protein [Sphingobacterium sp. UT-1RO-CII-1]MCY4778525.1 hypothetical protein [Sphingobacterium sp. UT-1RO-CII-1]